MAMELLVLSDRRLGTIAEWQRAIDAEKFTLRLSAETPFEELDGFLPAQFGDNETGFECAHWDARALIAESSQFDFRPPMGVRFGLPLGWYQHLRNPSHLRGRCSLCHGDRRNRGRLRDMRDSCAAAGCGSRSRNREANAAAGGGIAPTRPRRGAAMSPSNLGRDACRFRCARLRPGTCRLRKPQEGH